MIAYNQRSYEHHYVSASIIILLNFSPPSCFEEISLKMTKVYFHVHFKAHSLW